RHHRRVLPGVLRRRLPRTGAAAARDGQDGVRGSGPGASPQLTQQEGLSYAAAGVDIAAYTRMLERVKPLIAATQGPDVVTRVGPFAGLYQMPGGDLLAASTDSVGTKVKVAIAYGHHRGIGHDLVNHCANDIATAG